MPSLFKLITELPEEKWNYYAGSPNNVPLTKPIVDGNTSQQFIMEYFIKGGKEDAMNDFNLQTFSLQRADHTVSIFFLGLLLFHRTKFKDRIFFDGVVSDQYEFFQFIWFVTCLSHDAAFDEEENESLINSCPDLTALKQHFNIEYDLTAQDVANIPKDMFRLCEAYFTYRHDCNRTDHGIYAGLLMYDRLVKNRKVKLASGDKTLLWQPFLDKHYAYAAATVAVHNMWFPDELRIETYKAHGLESMVHRQCISFSEAPLLYLLGIVDTVDPVKAYKDCGHSPEFILKNIFLSFANENTFSIRVSKKLDFDTMKQKARSLPTWLDVRVQYHYRAVIIVLK